jgi:hypothetical protein
MPIRRLHQKSPSTTSSRRSTYRCWATLSHNLKECKRVQLQNFHLEIRNHHILYWSSSKKVLVKSHHSSSWQTYTLCSLLQLDYVPVEVCIPVPASQLEPWVTPSGRYTPYGWHDCIFCPNVSTGSGIQAPFVLVPEQERRGRGRPRRQSLMA